MRARYRCTVHRGPWRLVATIILVAGVMASGGGADRLANAAIVGGAGGDGSGAIVQTIAVRTLPDKLMIEIATSQPTVFQTMSLTDPARFVVDVPEAVLPAGKPRTVKPAEGPVTVVEAVPFGKDKPGVRVLVRLVGPRNCSVHRYVDGAGLLVTVPREAGPPASAAEPVAIARRQPPSPDIKANPTARAAPEATAAEAAPRVVRRNLDAVLPAVAVLGEPARTSLWAALQVPASRSADASPAVATPAAPALAAPAPPVDRPTTIVALEPRQPRPAAQPVVLRQMHRRPEAPYFEVVLDASGPLQFEPERLTEPLRYVLRVPRATLDGGCARSLPGDGGAVKQVTAEPDGDGVLVTVVLAEAADCRAYTLPDRPALVAEIHQRAATDSSRLAQAPAGTRAQPGAKSAAPAQSRERLINVDFQDADIQEVLGAIARFGGKSIVFSDKVTGSASLHLTNVTEREAMDLVCGLYHLGYVLIGDTTYVVGPPEELQKLPGGQRLLGLEFTYRAQHVKPSDVASFFGSLPTYQGLQITPVEAAGIVVFSRIPDAETRQKIDEQLRQIDVEPPAESRWIELAHLVPDKAAETVRRMLPGLQVLTPGTEVQGRVIRVQGSPALVAEAEQLVSKLDVEPPVLPEDKGAIVVVTQPVNYITPQAAQSFLLAMFPEEKLDIATSLGADETAPVQGDSTRSGGLRQPAKLIIRGPSKVVQQAVDLVVELDLPPPQVQISTALTEVVLENQCQEGFVWTLPGLVLSELAPAANGFKFGRIRRDPMTFQATMQALQKNSRSKILARPKLVAVSGKTADILVGQRIPFETTIPGEGTVTRSVNFQDVGLGLTFTPVVGSDGAITLYIAPMVSSFQSFSPQGYPIVSTRQASTIVRCHTGDMIVIGGLLNEDETKVLSGIPFLKNIPVLGELFKARDNRRTRTDLVIFAQVELLASHERPETQAPVTQQQQQPAPEAPG